MTRKRARKGTRRRRGGRRRGRGRVSGRKRGRGEGKKAELELTTAFSRSGKLSLHLLKLPTVKLSKT